MIDNYFSRLERIIAPRKYSLKRHGEREEDSMIHEQPQQVNTKLIGIDTQKNSSMSTRGAITNQPTSAEHNPKRNEQHINSNQNQNQNPLDLILIEESKSPQFLNNNKNELNISDLKEELAEEKKRNMFHRHEISELTRKINFLNDEIKDKEETIQKFIKEKDIDLKYLLRLEHMINNLQGHMNKEEILRLENSKAFENDKTLLNSLSQENKKLKSFEREIYQISRTYDGINDNVLQSLSEIEKLFLALNQSLENDHNEKQSSSSSFPLGLDYNFRYLTLDKVKVKFEDIAASLDDLIKSKHEEYKYLLDEKEKENLSLSAELYELKHTIELMNEEKNSQMKVISDLRNEVMLLKAREEEYKSYLMSNGKRCMLDNKKKLSDEKMLKKDVMEKVEPMKRSVKKSVSKMTGVFDLMEPSNAKFVNNIKSKLLQ